MMALQIVADQVRLAGDAGVDRDMVALVDDLQDVGDAACARSPGVMPLAAL